MKRLACLVLWLELNKIVCWVLFESENRDGFRWNSHMLIEVMQEERNILWNWKKCGDALILVKVKAEAVLYASRGVDISIIAEMVDQTGETVRDWLSQWRLTRLHSVVTGYADNQNAAKLTRT